MTVRVALDVAGHGLATSRAACGAADPAILVVDTQMRVRLRNGAADALVSRGVIKLDSDARMAGPFAAGLRARFGDPREQAPLLLQSPDCDETYLGVCVTPLRTTEADDFRLFVLIVRDARAELHDRARAVARSNGLTDSEERLLLLMVDGLDPQTAARRLGIARSTARTHLQRVFEKVGVSRQSELVAFIARVSNVGGSSAFCRALRL